MPEENWLQNSDVLTLFPTLMWKIQLLPEFAETQNLKIISALKKINPDVTDFEETASWQSPQSLHQETELDQLMLCINSTAQKVLRFLNIGATDIEDTLLLFPSYLVHSVDANDSSEPRISISFNFMFSEFAETMSKPLWESPPSGA